MLAFRRLVGGSSSGACGRSVMRGGGASEAAAAAIAAVGVNQNRDHEDDYAGVVACC